MHNTHSTRLDCLLDLRLVFTLLVLYIFVSFHSVCFACTRLSIGKYSGVVAIDNLTHHPTYSNLVEEVLLSSISIANFIELESFHFFVLEIIFEIHYITLAINVHLP